MSLIDLGLDITPIRAALIGMALLLVIGLELGLWQYLRGRRRRRAHAARAGGASAGGQGGSRGRVVHRAVIPPLFAERDTAPDEMTARLHAATDPFAVMEVLRSADGPDVPLPVPVVATATVTERGPESEPEPAPASVASDHVSRPTVQHAPSRLLMVPSPPSHGDAHKRSSDVALIASVLAGGLAVLLVARRRARRSGR